MCEQCLTAPVYFGQPLPGWTLARARAEHPNSTWHRGEWGLIRIDDPAFRWRITPTRSPDHGMPEEEADAYFNSLDPESPEHRRLMVFTSESWADFSEAFERCDAVDGYELIKAAVQVGYDDSEGYGFSRWLFDYLGAYLGTATPEYDDAGDAWYRDRFGAASIDGSIGAAPLPGEPGHE
ncbi:hypothetical protein [Gordonia phthalatica]|uniref:Uncharacterized protein n=1 Tax=Gordonia phthalatica TaxID=1136941 RepID=A0A0N9MV70_9ACTN|nr:hypothetical protein [Gordonia phthalatica]ALG86568.1 hypothetical protein ACH46_03315 [Gordonia phthalatica]